jgi:hypothetical protein
MFLRQFHKTPNQVFKPNLGMNTTSHLQTTPADALFHKVRQRVLAVLFVSPDRSFYANEIIALDIMVATVVKQ